MCEPVQLVEGNPAELPWEKLVHYIWTTDMTRMSLSKHLEPALRLVCRCCVESCSLLAPVAKTVPLAIWIELAETFCNGLPLQNDDGIQTLLEECGKEIDTPDMREHVFRKIVEIASQPRITPQAVKTLPAQQEQLKQFLESKAKFDKDVDQLQAKIEQIREQLYCILAKQDATSQGIAMIRLEIEKIQALDLLSQQQQQRAQALQQALQQTLEQTLHAEEMVDTLDPQPMDVSETVQKRPISEISDAPVQVEAAKQKAPRKKVEQVAKDRVPMTKETLHGAVRLWMSTKLVTVTLNYDLLLEEEIQIILQYCQTRDIVVDELIAAMKTGPWHKVNYVSLVAKQKK